MRREQPWKTERARVLRASQTAAERKLWHALRARRLVGHKFVRQAPIGPYYVDFLCRDKMLVVEVDGGTHSTDEERANDAIRTAALKQLGYRVHRVWNGDIYDNLDGVLDHLMAILDGST